MRGLRVSGTNLHKRDLLTEKFIKDLHKRMLGEVWKWAGTKRLTELNIGLPAPQIDINLQNLLDDLHHWSGKTPMPILEQAARLHHRAVLIHPFLNGNGRWSRLLANIWLKRHGNAITQWPDEAVGASSVIRDQYRAAIKAGDKGDLSLLIELHQRYTPPGA